MKIKNIFQKNQVIIFALAIMICVAGYLNFSRDKAEEEKKEQQASTDINEKLFGDLEGDLLVDTDISDEDLAADGQLVNETGVLVNDPISSETKLLKEDETAGETVKNQEEDAKTIDNDNPGEAILTSTIAGTDFATAKLKREQIRAKNREDLMAIVNDTTIADDKKQEAIDAVLELNDIAERENTTEILLEAKGYSGAVVCILDDTVDVIINCEALSMQDLAIIEDVVKRKTGSLLENINITPVIAED